MTKIEKLLEGIQDLKTKGFDPKKIDALTEGINLIASEYRKRKAKEDQAKLEAAGFEQLDEHRKASGLSTKAFVESVGKTIIESEQSEENKEKMMESLGRYAAYLEAGTVPGCRFGCELLDEKAKEKLGSGDIWSFLQFCVLPETHSLFRDAATARWNQVCDIAEKKSAVLGGKNYKVSRALLDSSHEKLLILSPETPDAMGEAYFMFCADTPKTID